MLYLTLLFGYANIRLEKKLIKLRWIKPYNGELLKKLKSHKLIIHSIFANYESNKTYFRTYLFFVWYVHVFSNNVSNGYYSCEYSFSIA